ncbi:MAG: hypothetical protein AAFV37_14315 [Pseudomonadota bacterium]
MGEINDEKNWGWSMIAKDGDPKLTVSALPDQPRVKIQTYRSHTMSIRDAKMFRRALTRAIRMAEENGARTDTGDAE